MKAKSRPSPSIPIHSLLDELRDLQVFLNQPGEKMKLLEAYDHFIKESDKGRMCTYSLKCKALFETNMYSEVRDRIKSINNLLNIIEGNKDGGSS